MAKVKIGLIQSKDHGSKEKNLRNTVIMIRKAAKQGAKIICLQELFATPYFPQTPKVDVEKYSDPIPGEITRTMSALAKQLEAALIVPFCEKAKDGKYYNTAVVFDEKGRLIGKYHKIHTPHDPGFYEKDYFGAGDRGYLIVKTRSAKIAVLICYDQWFPEAARAARLKGAEIIFYPTGIGDIIGYDPEGDWHDAWETAQRGHAIANSVHVAAVNRVGREGRMKFFGQSFVSDPFGKVLKRASKNHEEVIIAEFDLSRNEFFAEGWGFLRNRRPETYSDLLSEKFVKRLKKLARVAHYKDEIRALETP